MNLIGIEMIDKEIRDLLPDIIKNAMDVLTENTNATDEMTLPVTLAVATFATQGLADAHPILWDTCAISNYYCVLIPSGGLKTSTLDALLVGARKFEKDSRQLAQDSEIEYQIAMKQYDNDIKERIKQKNQIVTPGITPAPTNPFTRIIKPNYPRTSRYIASKFTLNGIIQALKGVPHFGIFNSDAAEFFNSHAFKDKSTATEIISALSKLWSGEQIDKLTGIEDIQTEGKRTTALFMLQQQLADFFVNSQFKDQGFTNRILITQSEKISKKRANFADNKIYEKITTDDRLLPFNDRVYELLTDVDNIQKNPKKKGLLDLRKHLIEQEKGEKDINILNLDVHPICMTDNSRQILQDFYNDMIEKSEDEEYSEYHNFIVRAYEHCIRIATVLSLFDRRNEVNERDCGCSVGLMYYFIDQRMNLTIDGSIKIDEIVDCANRIKQWLKKEHPTNKVSKTELNNYGPPMYRSMKVDQRDKVMEELLSRDVIEVISEGRTNYIKLNVA